MSSIAVAGSGGGSGLFTLVSNPPVNQNAPGTPFQLAFDSEGNLYICYQTNMWAKYVNAAPFITVAGRFAIQGNVIYFRAGRAPMLRIGTGSI